MPVCPNCKSAFLKQSVNELDLMFCKECGGQFRLYAVEPPALLRKSVIAQLRWMCKVVKEKLGLTEDEQLEGLVSLDNILKMLIKEGNI